MYKWERCCPQRVNDAKHQTMSEERTAVCTCISINMTESLIKCSAFHVLTVLLRSVIKGPKAFSIDYY